MKRPFRAPIDSPLSPLIRAIFPLFLRLGKSQVRVKVTPECRDILRRMKGQRCMLIPNHPSQSEPLVMFELARQIRQQFLFVVAWQVFERLYGFQGWLLQRVGSYSLIRGIADRASFRYSRTVLSEGRAPLVIFAEGFATNHNEVIFPIESGTIGLGFMALNDFHKQFPNKDLPSLYLVPIGIQYQYDDCIQSELEKSIRRLEEAVGFQSDFQNITFEQRLIRLGEFSIRRLAAEYGLPLTAEGQLNSDTLELLHQALLEKLERLFSLSDNGELSVWSRIKRIHGLKDINLNEEVLTDYRYEQTIFKRKNMLAELFFHQLLTLHGGLIEERPTIQRMVEVTRRLEKEILGAAKCQAPRTAVIKAASPINLADYYAAYCRERKLTLQQIAHKVRTAMQELVDPTGKIATVGYDSEFKEGSTLVQIISN